MKAIARAYANFALIKYWGKKDELLKLPVQSSLSFTVDEFYTDMTVTFKDNLKKDVLYIDELLITDKKYTRIHNFMNIVRQRYKIDKYAVIESSSNVHIGAGLASSASSFAALAYAVNLALNLKLSKKELSILARLGSGSASRSIHGGFSLWKAGTDETSYATSLKIDWPEFRMIAVIVNDNEKKIGSSEAMKASLNSPFYDAYVKQSKNDLKAMQNALKEKDIYKVGDIAERNALLMHSTLLPLDLWYFLPDTIKIMNEVKKLRENNIPVYFTMDAGPNVKLITTQEYLNAITSHFKEYPLIVLKEGKAVYGKRIS
jgi:diphosphomevalonate decarboxylase